MTIEPTKFTIGKGRPGFREWISETSPNPPSWPHLPLTHITRGVVAEDILRAVKIEPRECNVFKEPLAYFFYGRPAYRVGNAKVTKAESLCPFCFIFDPDLAQAAKAIYAFDTGALSMRMYSQVLPDELNPNDFSLQDISEADRLISGVFGSQMPYFDGNTIEIAGKQPNVEPHHFAARAYIDLLVSPGRNEPDDRILSIEVVLGTEIPLGHSLIAIAMPHTLTTGKAPWIQGLSKRVELVPYDFVPGRHPEYYQTLMEKSVKAYYERAGFL